MNFTLVTIKKEKSEIRNNNISSFIKENISSELNIKELKNRATTGVGTPQNTKFSLSSKLNLDNLNEAKTRIKTEKYL